MTRWILAFVAAIAVYGGAVPGRAQRQPSTGAPSGPIFNGRQHEPTVIGRVPPEEQHPSPREQDELDAIYRDVMARSAPPGRSPASDTPPPSVGRE